jgi:hypothetical protein
MLSALSPRSKGVHPALGEEDLIGFGEYRKWVNLPGGILVLRGHPSISLQTISFVEENENLVGNTSGWI